MNEHYPFSLTPLPYDYEALSPYIGSETLYFHHDKHLQTYVDNLNKTLGPHREYHDWCLEKLITENDALPEAIRIPVKNNAGGVYNHVLYFDCMAAPGSSQPSRELTEAIERDFGSLDGLLAKIKEAALAQFGSGWAWLVSDDGGALQVVKTPNQDTPLPLGLYPLLLVDVWEHAYYLQYQNRRAEYLDQWKQIINWQKVNERYSSR